MFQELQIDQKYNTILSVIRFVRMCVRILVDVEYAYLFL